LSAVIFVLLYFRINSAHKTLTIPKNANKNDSFCDFNYVSQLKLKFDDVTFIMLFKRDEIENEQPAQAYCNK